MNLAPGERKDDVELVSISTKEEEIEIINEGIKMTLSVKSNSFASTSTPAPAAAGVPEKPGGVDFSVRCLLHVRAVPRSRRPVGRRPSLPRRRPEGEPLLWAETFRFAVQFALRRSAVSGGTPYGGEPARPMAERL